MSGYRVTVRRSGAVERSAAETLAEALDAAEGAARDAGRSERRAPVDLRVRAYAPSEQVAARIEIRGDGLRAGVDVHGDGSMTAYTGRLRRHPIAEAGEETALGALRRVLGDASAG